MHAQASDYGTESHAHAFSKPAREVKYVEAGREGSPLMHATTQVEHPEVNAVTQTSLSGGEGTHATTQVEHPEVNACLLYTSPSPRDRQKSRMPSSA